VKNDAYIHPNLVVNRYGVFESSFTDSMGRRIRRSLKTKDRELATLMIGKVMKESYEKGYFEMKKPVKILFRDLAQKVLDCSKDLSSYKKKYISVMRSLVAYFGDKCVHEITNEQICTFKTNRKAPEGVKQKGLVAASTANTELVILKKCFNLAVRWGYIQKNPADGIKKHKVQERAIRFLNREEISRLLQSCVGYVHDMILFAIYTGARTCEVLNMTWKNVNFETGKITFEKTKNCRLRHIKMTPEVRSMLIERQKASDKNECVFVNKETGKPFTSILDEFRNVLKTAGVEKCRFYDLRHTFASQHVMAGTAMRDLMEMLGHADLKTTLIYAHVSTRHVDDAMDNYEKHLKQIVSLRREIGEVALSK